MPPRANLVNLDAMIDRADFATEEAEGPSSEKIPSISVRDFTAGGLVGPSLRKPDFQRETNHWSPSQVVSLLECYVNGELIPSVILWKSPAYLFVIDGGHRLSAIRAWIEDDYGDGPLSQAFFGFQISAQQRRAADATRSLIDSRIGSWKRFEQRQALKEQDPEERRRLTQVISRALPIQWVTGDADKAESSFFRINTQGTPLDHVEELLLRTRRKPLSIGARAIIRAGKGHKYWSAFGTEHSQKIEDSAKSLHQLLFEPDLNSPLKTLDLPLGGSKGVRTALEVLIEFLEIACRRQGEAVERIKEQDDDVSGELTVDTLRRALRLIRRVTGNDTGSLGLHPAVYFYGPTGRHSGAMFMGTVSVIARHLGNNDSQFFITFTDVRGELEAALIKNKDLIATILQKHSSKNRHRAYEAVLDALIEELRVGNHPSEEWFINVSGLRGKLVTGLATGTGQSFSDDVKNQAFISMALEKALKCEICHGYLDPDKSVSYDHIVRRRDGGSGDLENCRLVHPYCNQSVHS